jgi:ankyrin repeat protein
LAHNASPFLHTSSKDTKHIIIHDIIYQRGILEPLIQLPDLDLEQRDGDGRTLLLAACSPKNMESCSNFPFPKNWKTGIRSPEAIYQLCEMGADLTATDKNGDNALHLLLGASQEWRRYGKKNVLAWSEPISFVLDTVPDLIAHRNRHGYTPFHTAAENHLFPLLDLLIDRGADPIKPDPNGNTILHHLAIRMQKNQAPTISPEIASFISRGLDVNIRNNDGETPLFKYISSATSDLRVYSHTIIEQFVEMGADIFTQNDAGENILHVDEKHVFLTRQPIDKGL